MILSRAPLTEQAPCVRLACIRHAASVRPEPGSNSSLYGLDGRRSGIRPHRNGSGTCASSRFSCEGTFGRRAGHGRIKNQGSAAVKRADTWRRLWPPGQRVSQKGRNAREPSCYVYHLRGETTAATTERSIARAPTGVKSAGQWRRPCTPSATIPPGTALVKPVLRTVGKVLYRIQTSNDNIPGTRLA